MTPRFAAAALVVAACSGRPTVPTGARLGSAIAAALVAADQTREPWRCAAPEGPSLATETLATGSRRWQLAAHAMTLEAEGDVAIGVIADAAGSSPPTLAALGRLRAQLGRVDLVIALGGMGTTQAELEAAFAALADRATWPLVAMPGDLEPVDALAGAIAAARQRGAAVVDGRLVQRIELPAATIALVPGAGAASRLVAGRDGCSYRASDVTAALAALTPLAGLRILASAEPPRTTRGDAATGELGLTPGAGQQIDLALHGPTDEAASPARSGHRDGAAVALTPGSSDATIRWPGAARHPTAGVLTVRGNAWSWRPVEDAR
jgi:hypothetical protein